MKNSILAFIITLLYLSGFGQTYQRLYSQNPLYSNPTSCLVAGAYNNGTAIFMNKTLNVTDSLGNIVLRTAIDLVPGQMLRTADHGYILASPQITYNQFASLTKCDSMGNILWQKMLSDTLNIISLWAEVDASGNTYLLEDSAYNQSGGNMILLRKYTALGGVVWSKVVDPLTAGFTIAGNGNVALYGQGFFIKQLDANGDSVWQQNYTHAAALYPGQIITLPSGGFLTATLKYNVSLSFKLYESDAAGNLIDSMSLPGYVSANANAILGVSFDGSITFYASSYDSVTHLTTASLTDISTFGQINWQRTFIGIGSSNAFGISPLPNGFIISGDTVNAHSFNTIFIDRLDLSGQCSSPLVIDSSFYYFSSYGVIDTNNIAAGFNTTGDLFSKDTIASFGTFSPDIIQEFRVPKSGPVHAIFEGNIWVAGQNNGNLFSSSEQYGSGYQPGPATTLPADASKWDNIWAISRTDVLSVKNDFDTHHAITQPVPASVLTWPARGNASAAGAGGAPLIIDQDMAPFVDRNGDGIYNVYDGDYPLIRGDKMIWWINNDIGSKSQKPMGVDRRYSVYEYNSLTDSNLNNTLFLSVMIKNQSPRAYDSVTIASFVDFDLGCANNDRTGSIPSKNTFFVYNGYVQGATQQNGITCDEGSVCPVGEVGYGCSLPIMSATFLNDSMKVYCYYTNSASTGLADPSDDQGYYRYMNGQWNDGTPLTFGGNGYGGSTPYPYAFPGNPADGSQWSECNPQTGPAIAANDRRSVGAIGPFALAVGDTISFDMAFIFHPGSFDNCPDLSDSSSVVQHIDSISRYYASERFTQWYDSSKSLVPAFTNVGITNIATGPIFSLIPNPNNGSFNIHLSNGAFSDYTISITDMLGRLVYYEPNAHAPDQTVRMGNASSGVYSVTIEAQNFKATKKVVVTAQ